MSKDTRAILTDDVYDKEIDFESDDEDDDDINLVVLWYSFWERCLIYYKWLIDKMNG